MTDKEIMQEAARLTAEINGLVLAKSIERIGREWSARDIQAIMSIATGMTATALLNVACSAVVPVEKVDFLLDLFPTLFDTIRSVSIENAQKQAATHEEILEGFAKASSGA